MLSEIIENIGDECGYSVVTTDIVNSTDVTTKMLLGMCNRVANEMAQAYLWPQLNKSGSITLVDSQGTYALPADFSNYHFDTFWNQSDQWRVFGPLTPQQYAERQGYGDNLSVYDEFTFRGITNNQLLIYPTPGSGNAGNVIIFEYFADRPIRPRTWETGQAVVSGDYTFYNGTYYTATTTGTTGGSDPTADTGVTWTEYTGKYRKFLKDTDVCVLNERILEQGVMERFAVKKQLNVLPLFNEQLEQEFGKFIQGKTVYASNPGKSRFQHANNERVAFGS